MKRSHTNAHVYCVGGNDQLNTRVRNSASDIMRLKTNLESLWIFNSAVQIDITCFDRRTIIVVGFFHSC